MFAACGVITLTTDFGPQGPFVATMKGRILARLPEARIIDVTHDVPVYWPAEAGFWLVRSFGYFPAGTVHVAVVDPGVGTSRRGIVITTPNGLLVGPDNGLLVWAAEALGGIESAHEIRGNGAVSSTFHGRDVFAPAAARLALGGKPSEAGPEIDKDSLVRLPDPAVTVGDGWLEAEVLTVDRFGNVQLAATGEMLRGLGNELVINGTVSAHLGRTFADVSQGDLLVFEDSAGHVAIAVNNGRAVVVLSVRPGDVVKVASR